MLVLLALLSVGCIDDPAETTIPGSYEQEYRLLWNLFDQHYVGFEIKEADWNSLFDQYISKTGEVNSREGMAELELKLLEHLYDSGVELISPIGSVYSSFEPETFTNCDSTVLMTYLDCSGFQWMQQDIWGYCLAGSDSIPYFVIRSWSSSLNMSLLDNVLQPLSDRPAMILDVRLTSGGFDGTVSNFTRRFVEEPVIGHMTQQRLNSGTHELADPVPVTVFPRGWHFEGQVVVLSGERNAGTSELFLCNMLQLPDVVLMGDTTQGAGNWQCLVSQLPEGWFVTCPNVTLLTADTVFVEGSGIAPDLYVEALPEDFQNGYDPVLESAFDYLGAQVPKARM